MIDELTLTPDHAELILEKAIEFEAYSDEMPESDKDKIEAAHEQIAFMLDAAVDEGVRPDADDEDVAEAGKQMWEIFEIAGIEVDDEGNVTFGELPEIETEGGDNSDDEFDINDLIKNYDKLSTAKVLAALEDLDEEQVEQVKEYEREEGKGRDGILEYEPEEADGDDDNEGDGDEDGESLTRADLDEYDRDALKALIKENELGIRVGQKMTDDDIRDKIAEVAELESGYEDDEPEAGGDEEPEENDGDTAEEPWEGYDGTSVKDIKEALTAAQEDEDDPLTAEQVEGVITYEESREKPRTSLVKWLNELRDTLEGGGDEDDDNSGGDDGDGDATVGSIVITREQILEALANGQVEIEV